MKVLFLIQGWDVAASRYRVLQYLPYLKSDGVETEVTLYPRTLKENIRFFYSLPQYDIVFLQRKRFSQPRLGWLRKRAKRVVYDFDDSVMYRNSKAKDPISKTRKKRFIQMIEASDYVIAGNEFLKNEVYQINPNVEVIPTSIDLSRYSLKEGYHSEGPITLGWLGSSSTLKYLKHLLPTLEKIFNGYPHFQLKIVCDQFLDSPCLPIIKKRWSSEEEEADLKSFDIGIMPLSDDLWSRGKCGLKILQYQSVGAPVICTPVGVNRDIVKHGINGFWAQDEDQWKKGLSKLIQEEGLRREMGLEGRKTVERDYSLDVNAPRILDVLKKVSII